MISNKLADISLVGPRPLRTLRIYPTTVKEKQIRHTIRQEITGLAQVSEEMPLVGIEKLKLGCSICAKIIFYNDLN